MTSSLTKQPDGTLELLITVAWSEVKTNYDAVLEQAVKDSELPGFRKGKAPRKLVEEKTDKTHLYEEVLKRLIPQVYSQAVQEQKLHPIVTPKIELKEASEAKDWVLRALTCERPTINLGDYKSAVAQLKETKQKKIWVPGQDLPAGRQGPKAQETKETKPTLDELLTALLPTITIAIPGLLLEQEVNRQLSDLIDQTKKLGLSVEQYLASTNRTAEGVRAEYSQQATRTLTLEFGLEAIADKEGILVSDDDIAAVIKTAKSDAERKTLESQRYYLASVLRRQKTLDFLAAL